MCGGFTSAYTTDVWAHACMCRSVIRAERHGSQHLGHAIVGATVVNAGGGDGVIAAAIQVSPKGLPDLGGGDGKRHYASPADSTRKGKASAVRN